ncbi:FAD:protein FMN transferase [Collinsella sp. AGMB00827]|uniref:FAD:protein FMN transferase n=1 Tax=Collinsella ureilytica TaxID=2869515 RepID=A0ABS7MJX1_9ACTN|nr:FAD:protein FMN transferase [Collinsella urealyticum]MBY4797659.1 FAD:protein FMN transferase [Collinsella urealyticum]
MLTREFRHFNTVNTVVADTQNEGLLDEVVALCDRYDQMFSRFNPASELFCVNEALRRGEGAKLSQELELVLQIALAYCEATGGLFDITMGSVTRLWNMSRGIVPDSDKLARALQQVGWEHLTIEDGYLRATGTRPCLDLGGIAKGYIADRMLDLLEDGGSRHSLVNLGGNVAMRGGKPDEQTGDITPWRIGLREPVASSATSPVRHFAVVSIESGSVVTSGVYERAFERDNTTYHHILSPKTGMPVPTDVLGATIISERSIDGDGYTTALVAMGAEAAINYAERVDGLEAVIVDTAGDVLATTGVGTEKIGFTLATSTRP